MFDFEKLNVYTKAKAYNKKVTTTLQENSFDSITYNQLRRASFSIMLNIAEGTGRYTNPDKRNFYVIARGSAFECIAIFDYLKDLEMVTVSFYKEVYGDLEEISKMLFAMIKGLK